MRTKISGNACAPAFLDPLPQAHALLNDVGFTGKPRASDRDDRHNDHQRPQAELKPAAFAFRRLSSCRLGLHGRIIPDRGQPEQETRAAGIVLGSCAGQHTV
jgi:hypothetical protein